jgi:hypothetical protein
LLPFAAIQFPRSVVSVAPPGGSDYSYFESFSPGVSAYRIPEKWKFNSFIDQFSDAGEIEECVWNWGQT